MRDSAKHPSRGLQPARNPRNAGLAHLRTLIRQGAASAFDLDAYSCMLIEDTAPLSAIGRRIGKTAMHGDAKNLLKELKSGLAALYGDRLYGVYLYGSYARGDYDAESDFDVLVVPDDFESYGAEVDRTAELAAHLSLEQGVSISQVFFRAHDWTKGDTPFLRAVRQEAIAA